MELRSGRRTDETKENKDMREAAQTLLSLNEFYINKKIQSAPSHLKENCGECLRQIIEESVMKGINIKFEQ